MTPELREGAVISSRRLRRGRPDPRPVAAGRDSPTASVADAAPIVPGGILRWARQGPLPPIAALRVTPFAEGRASVVPDPESRHRLRRAGATDGEFARGGPRPRIPPAWRSHLAQTPALVALPIAVPPLQYLRRPEGVPAAGRAKPFELEVGLAFVGVLQRPAAIVVPSASDDVNRLGKARIAGRVSCGLRHPPRTTPHRRGTGR
jgi:hypothetical protein